VLFIEANAEVRVYDIIGLKEFKGNVCRHIHGFISCSICEDSSVSAAHLSASGVVVLCCRSHNETSQKLCLKPHPEIVSNGFNHKTNLRVSSNQIIHPKLIHSNAGNDSGV